MNHQAASDFCFFVGEDCGETYVIVNSIESFARDGHVDDTSEFDSEIEKFLPPNVEQATDSTWMTEEYTPARLRDAMLKCGFVEKSDFTAFMKDHM